MCVLALASERTQPGSWRQAMSSDFPTWKALSAICSEDD
jgi:hypothetical protein